MKILGIIPARGGSKRLPRKNLSDLGGKPLVRHILDTAIESSIFDHLWVSSEDDEIGAVVGKYWWKRPEHLARDTSSTLSTVLDVLAGHKVDVICTMQPTSPFTLAEDIKNSLALLIGSNADSVISTTEAPSDLAFQIRWANRLESVPNIVVPNGAIYIATNDILQNGGDWYSGRLYGYPMPKERSLDIDNGQDLEMARHLLRVRNETSQGNS
jgi:CMP-N,N'-diacetyllegionaminic acid synthase